MVLQFCRILGKLLINWSIDGLRLFFLDESKDTKKINDLFFDELNYSLMVCR